MEQDTIVTSGFEIASMSCSRHDCDFISLHCSDCSIIIHALANYTEDSDPYCYHELLNSLCLQCYDIYNKMVDVTMWNRGFEDDMDYFPINIAEKAKLKKCVACVILKLLEKYPSKLASEIRNKQCIFHVSSRYSRSYLINDFEIAIYWDCISCTGYMEYQENYLTKMEHYFKTKLHCDICTNRFHNEINKLLAEFHLQSAFLKRFEYNHMCELCGKALLFDGGIFFRDKCDYVTI